MKNTRDIDAFKKVYKKFVLIIQGDKYHGNLFIVYSIPIKQLRCLTSNYVIHVFTSMVYFNIIYKCICMYMY